MILFGHFTALYRSHSQSKNGFYFPNFMYFSTYFPNFNKYFPKCEEKSLDAAGFGYLVCTVMSQVTEKPQPPEVGMESGPPDPTILL